MVLTPYGREVTKSIVIYFKYTLDIRKFVITV